jgi:hypothetical protein
MEKIRKVFGVLDSTQRRRRQSVGGGENRLATAKTKAGSQSELSGFQVLSLKGAIDTHGLRTIYTHGDSFRYCEHANPKLLFRPTEWFRASCQSADALSVLPV